MLQRGCCLVEGRPQAGQGDVDALDVGRAGSHAVVDVGHLQQTHSSTATAAQQNRCISPHVGRCSKDLYGKRKGPVQATCKHLVLTELTFPTNSNTRHVNPVSTNASHSCRHSSEAY
jgi:hypothetical protein